MENKFKKGDIVYAKVEPIVKLIITDFKDDSYRCKTLEDLNKNDLVYSEIELMEVFNFNIKRK